jgi:D-alanine--poly(phosphoribitol) ligase subunit 2
MAKAGEAEVREFILARAGHIVRALGIGEEVLSEDFSLTGSGIFDSMQLVELMTDIESQFEIEVDLSDFDPAEFDTLSGFSRCVVSRA